MLGHERWLEQASNELKSAQALIQLHEDFAIGTILYLCQQCFEKACKAYLLFKKQPLKKTHDLILLIELCTLLDNDFQQFITPAQELNPFNTGTRYPDDKFLVPDKSIAEYSLKQASSFVQFVQNKCY